MHSWEPTEYKGIQILTIKLLLVISIVFGFFGTPCISTISYAESNDGIFILIAPLGITNTKTNVLRVICLSVSKYTYCERFVNNTISLDFQRP